MRVSTCVRVRLCLYGEVEEARRTDSIFLTVLGLGLGLGLGLITPHTDSIFLTVLGNLALATMPVTIGSSTTCIVEMATPSASTGTRAPRRTCDAGDERD